MNTISAGTSAATSNSIDKFQRAHSIRNGLFCALAMAAAVLISNPSGDMPFIDGFSYDKTALEFARTGHMVYNGWATAMLGWQIPWGALFIKLFGFSFTGMRLSMLPLAMLTVFLFHQILRRFGVNAQNSVFGALTLGISPLFLPMATSFMTDVPGLLVILVCIYMCQRAVAADSDRAALIWLCTATVVNVAGGTVRQIAWLGALIMVPCTAWLLRERRGMKVAAVLLFLFAFAGVEVCMHWFARQPYSVPEPILMGTITPHAMVHMTAQLVKSFLCLLLVILPITVASLATVRRLGRNARLRIAVALCVAILIACILYGHGKLQSWLMPWLAYLLAGQSTLASHGISFRGLDSIKLVISLAVVASILVLLEQWMADAHEKRQAREKWQFRWNELGWILGPFSVAYLLLLAPSAAFSIIQARYVLGLVPSGVIALLLFYQERNAPKISRIDVATLAAFAIFSIAGTHDFFSESRAMARTLRVLKDSAIDRRMIQAGFPDDGWVQIKDGGHINDRRITVPAGAYRRTGIETKYPQCYTNWFGEMTPSINPEFFILPEPLSCLAATRFPPVGYSAWLPPFHRAIYVQQLKAGAK